MSLEHQSFLLLDLVSEICLFVLADALLVSDTKLGLFWFYVLTSDSNQVLAITRSLSELPVLHCCFVPKVEMSLKAARTVSEANLGT